SIIFIREFAVSNLIPAYRERGYLKARFADPQARFAADQNCKNGVHLSVPVTESLPYAWDRADWSGNEVLSSEALNGLMSIRHQEIANGLKIDSGLKAIHDAYAKRGFIAVKLTPFMSFDDDKKLVAYSVIVTEGPQYRMGFLMLAGVLESEAATLKTRWK